MAKVEQLNNQQAGEDIDPNLLESAKHIGKRAMNYSADLAIGTSHSASGGRLGVTMREARRGRQEEPKDESQKKPEGQ